MIIAYTRGKIWTDQGRQSHFMRTRDLILKAELKNRKTLTHLEILTQNGWITEKAPTTRRYLFLTAALRSSGTDYSIIAYEFQCNRPISAHSSMSCFSSCYSFFRGNRNELSQVSHFDHERWICFPTSKHLIFQSLHHSVVPFDLAEDKQLH